MACLRSLSRSAGETDQKTTSDRVVICNTERTEQLYDETYAQRAFLPPLYRRKHALRYSFVVSMVIVSYSPLRNVQGADGDLDATFGDGGRVMTDSLSKFL